MDERHNMNLVNQDNNGAEEWLCPTCGRRFTMAWTPHFHREILEPGDEYVIHTGGKGLPGLDVSMDDMEVGRDEPLPPEFRDWEAKHGK